MNKKLIIAWMCCHRVVHRQLVVHGVLLHSDYMQLINLFRAEGDQHKYFSLMILAHVIMAGAFVWIYARGVEAKPWVAQGVRFGVAVALLMIVQSTRSTSSCSRCQGSGYQADRLRRRSDGDTRIIVACCIETQRRGPNEPHIQPT